MCDFFLQLYTKDEVTGMTIALSNQKTAISGMFVLQQFFSFFSRYPAMKPSI